MLPIQKRCRGLTIKGVGVNDVRDRLPPPLPENFKNAELLSYYYVKLQALFICKFYTIHYSNFEHLHTMYLPCASRQITMAYVIYKITYLKLFVPVDNSLN